jgi:hypothetical protein
MIHAGVVGVVFSRRLMLRVILRWRLLRSGLLAVLRVIVLLRHRGWRNEDR